MNKADLPAELLTVEGTERSEVRENISMVKTYAAAGSSQQLEWDSLNQCDSLNHLRTDVVQMKYYFNGSAHLMKGLTTVMSALMYQAGWTTKSPFRSFLNLPGEPSP